MLKREEVYHIIDIERAYQDVTYDPRETLTSGQTRGQRDLDVTPGLVMLDGYIKKAMADWVGTKNSNLKSLQQVGKIAAIAVRILERAGGSEILLNEGLR